MVYFTSDWHLGHKSILKYRKQFENIKEHDDAIFEECKKLTKRDVLFIIGDFLFDCEDFDNYIKRLSKFPFRIKLVLGNHDSLKLYNPEIIEDTNIEIQLPLFSYKNMWIQHSPIHPQELRGRIGQIHGHLHNDFVMLDNEKDSRYFNVNLDNNNFKFVSLDTIKNFFKQLEQLEDVEDTEGGKVQNEN